MKPLSLKQLLLMTFHLKLACENVMDKLNSVFIMLIPWYISSNYEIIFMFVSIFWIKNLFWVIIEAGV